MLDLSNLDEIEIDLNEETAWVQAGATLGQLYYAIAKKSRVHGFPGGVCFSVGTGGIISGGGLGALMRKYGLAADNVVDARVMDVNGKILDREMNEDLFWAIRGGGGASFGVILAWKLKLIRLPEKVTVFTIRRNLEGNLTLLQKWENISHQLPKDLFIRAFVQKGVFPPGNDSKRIVGFYFQAQYLGPVEKLIPLLKQYFPEFNLERKDCFQKNITGDAEKECLEVPWIRSVLYFSWRNPNDSLEVLLEKTIPTHKDYHKGTSDFVKAPIPKSGWEMIEKLFTEEERPQMVFEPFGAKMEEISESEIPFPHRKGNLYNIQYFVSWDDNSERIASQKIAWIRKLYKEMEPYVAKSPRTAYLNYRDFGLGANQENYSYFKAKIWGEKYFNANFESNLNKIKIDLSEETAWVQAGETLGQVYYAISKKSKVHGFPGGVCFSIGTGGIISGGGLGALMRKFGLAADNVVDARVMDVNGKILEREKNEDLFWAIRGSGGASFGVLLAWKLKLVRVPEKLTVFTIRRKLEGNRNLLQKWEKISHQLPEDLFIRAIVQNGGSSAGNNVEKQVEFYFQAQYVGLVDELIPLLKQYFPEFNVERKDCFQENTTDGAEKECYEVSWIQSVLYFFFREPTESPEVLLDNTIPTEKNYNKGTSDFVKTPITKSAWEMIERLFLEEESPQLIFEPFGGKMNEISESKTPFPHRIENLYNILYLVNWSDNTENVSRKLYKKMEPYVAKSPRTAYLNYRDFDFGTNQEDYSYSKAKIWGEKYFNANFERLAKVKSKVDPTIFQK
ncbi:hypothetical protein BC332_04851 [Capsicum chinense]|nr:hypothetical protein BC332_04851 [Capsicum chinense]